MTDICDTIAAISTAIGNAGIGIVRISGDEATKIAAKVFKPKRKHSYSFDDYDHKCLYGYVMNNSGEMIDECLLLYMKSPRSFTTEDIVELHCHGGATPLSLVLQAVLDAGARLADPGEFTKRAFLNGRIDLTQAEAVDDIIRSKTDRTLALAMGQLNGGLGQKIGNIRKKIVHILAHLEAYIDFSDDIGEIDQGSLFDQTKQTILELQHVLKATDNGRIYREGAVVAIIGKPNAGKSSLMNALLRENRAIVTEIPGTTRDLIEESLSIKGIPTRIIDTAGIRETLDVVEKIGVERATTAMDLSDLVLFIIDSSKDISTDDIAIANSIGKKPVVCLFNKIDLPKRVVEDEILPYIKNCFDIIEISTLKDIGISFLEETIYKFLTSTYKEGDPIYLVNMRQKKSLESALSHLANAENSLSLSLPVDIITINYREAINALGEITGESVTDDVIDAIFSNFCVGK